jgi:NAD(P)-dependent dehydrogenase (short-subunit alcohol dehydrogenase family)
MCKVSNLPSLKDGPTDLGTPRALLASLSSISRRRTEGATSKSYDMDQRVRHINEGDSAMMAYPFSFLPQEFKGKRVLITGGTKGVGAATVQRFQMSGALVATTARSAYSESDSSPLFVKADIGTSSGVQGVVDRVEREWGGIDILVNNVGGTETKPGGFEALTDEDWQNILNINLLAAVRLDRAFLPGMIERGSASLFTSLRSHTGCRFPIQPSLTRPPKGRSAPTARALPRASHRKVYASS